MESSNERLTTEPGVNVTRMGFSSHDGVSQIKALIWTPDHVTSSPKGIIQITHGMAEHIGRYAGFANYLAQQGYVVCAADTIGHGLSVPAEEHLSCMPAEGGKDILIADSHELRTMVASRYGQQTPYIVFGHSMGSYQMRAYIARHGEGLAAAILCGTGNMSRTLSRAGNLLARMLVRFKGTTYRSRFLESMGTGAFSKAIENPRTPSDWLSTDKAVVDAYREDSLCGIPFSVGAYATLTDLTAEVASASSVSRIPVELPLLFIAGDQDPVGDNGRGVTAVAESAKQAGIQRVDVHLYPGMRHEILNEPEAQLVYTDIIHWLDSVL